MVRVRATLGMVLGLILLLQAGGLDSTCSGDLACACCLLGACRTPVELTWNQAPGCCPDGAFQPLTAPFDLVSRSFVPSPERALTGSSAALPASALDFTPVLPASFSRELQAQGPRQRAWLQIFRN